MAQILDPVPSENSEPILCCYVNATSRIQVVRITNIANWYFERVVFPGQRLMFEAPITGQLEVHTGMMASAILSDRIPCQKLAVQQMSSDALEGPEVEEEAIAPVEAAPAMEVSAKMEVSA